VVFVWGLVVGVLGVFGLVGGVFSRCPPSPSCLKLIPKEELVDVIAAFLS